jgi:hypothetical protein
MEPNVMDVCLKLLKNRPIYKKIIEEGVFTEEQLDDCILLLCQNDESEDA